MTEWEVGRGDTECYVPTHHDSSRFLPSRRRAVEDVFVREDNLKSSLVHLNDFERKNK